MLVLKYVVMFVLLLVTLTVATTDCIELNVLRDIVLVNIIDGVEICSLLEM